MYCVDVPIASGLTTENSLFIFPVKIMQSWQIFLAQNMDNIFKQMH